MYLPHSLPRLLCCRSTFQKHSSGVGVRGRTQGLCWCQTRGDNNPGAPCPALSLHLLVPKKTTMTLWNCHLHHQTPWGAWLLPPGSAVSLPSRTAKFPFPEPVALRRCGTALCCRWLRGHRPRPLLRVETPRFMSPERSLKDPKATKPPQEDAACRVPRHEEQQSPAGVSACLGFPFSLAGSRSGDYFWCCLALERVTHTPRASSQMWHLAVGRENE